MPLETVVLAFVAVAFVAIVWRFLPRSESGAVTMPAVLDRSIAMWLARRVLRRPTGPPAEEIPIAAPGEDEIAFRIGVPGAPPPTLPTRFVASQATSNAEPVPPARPALAIGDLPVGRRSTPRPSGALATQRRWAGAVALAVVAITITTLALGSRRLGGEVLSATGTPGDSPAGGFVSEDSAEPSGESTGSADPAPPSDLPVPPSAAAAATAASPRPLAAPAPQPTRTPRATAHPTPTPQRTQAPTTLPTIPPIASPSVEPIPSSGPSVEPSP
jgi:hypothetical protein